MKNEITIEPEDVEEIHQMILSWMGIDFNNEQIMTLMNSERSILEEMARYGVSDTPTRESLMEAIGERLTGEPYPSPPCDKAVHDEYYKKIMKKAKEHGFKVIENQ